MKFNTLNIGACLRTVKLTFPLDCNIRSLLGALLKINKFNVSDWKYTAKTGALNVMNTILVGFRLKINT